MRRGKECGGRVAKAALLLLGTGGGVVSDVSKVGGSDGIGESEGGALLMMVSVMGALIVWPGSVRDCMGAESGLRVLLGVSCTSRDWASYFAASVFTRRPLVE